MVENYQFGAIPLNLVDYVTKKSKSAKSYFRYLLNRTQMMFKYDGLPDSLDPHMLERYMQVNGVAIVAKAKGKIYAFNGQLGGRQEVYYRPTKAIVANPHISQLAKDEAWSHEYTVFSNDPDECDAVLFRNDLEWEGLTPLIARYAVLMAENCLTVRTADIMLRILALISAGTDKAKKSADEYIRKLENGELSVVADSMFQQSINMQAPPSNNGRYVTQFIELQQYLKGSFYNELGLRANYNMKREAIGEGESTMDADSVLPLCDNMLMCRQEDVDKLNKMFDLDVKVDFNSAWLGNFLASNIAIVSQLREAGIGAQNVVEPGGVNGDGAFGGEDPIAGSSNSGENGEGRATESGNQGTKEETGQTAGAENDDVERRTAEAGTGKSQDGVEAAEVAEAAEAAEAAEVDEVEGLGELDGEVEEVEVGEDLTIQEAAVEILNEKVSQLMEDVKKEEGGEVNGLLGNEDTEDKGRTPDN